jgi:DNA-binding HxlR family transcriptional regulator
MQPGKIKIFTALAGAKDGLKFTELRKSASLSAPVLSEYLAEMVDQGVVVREADRRYALAKIYYPLKSFANDYQKALKVFPAYAVRAAYEISEMKDNKAREEAFRVFLRYSFHFFMVLIWKIIGESIVDLSKKEDVKNQDLMVRMNATINDAFKDWVAPIANSLAVAMAVNIDIIVVGERFFAEVLNGSVEDTEELSRTTAAKT